jgi:phosphoglycerate dehydrogenase-like enzyme
MLNIGISRDVRVIREGFGVDSLDDEAGVNWRFLDDDTVEIRPADIKSMDALLLGGTRVTPTTLEGNEQLALVTRFGAGYDRVDVEACTNNAVIVANTPLAVKRPVAAMAAMFILALGHDVANLDRLVRAGTWPTSEGKRGIGLVGRTLGLLGLGSIGQEIVKLMAPFGMRVMAYDPYVSPDTASAVGVELGDLETVLAQADFVCVGCTLTDETRNLLNATTLALMKPTSFVINVARGPIINQQALTEALQNGRIRGAGLDVFETEPIDPKDPLLSLDNVIVTPHQACMTDQCAYDIGRQTMDTALGLRSGKLPDSIINREVLDDPRLQAKLRRLSG